MLKFFNQASSQDIQDITGCKPEAADKITDELRPFDNLEDLREKLKRTKGLSVKYMDTYLEMNKGYYAVDQIIKEIERMGGELKDIINIWKGLETESRENSGVSTPIEGDIDERAGLHLTNINITNLSKSSTQYRDALDGFLTEQPRIVNKDMQMKDYQLLGINWMLLLYRKKISGILADEMGLGKTAQVITFLGRLYEMGECGPHLIVVPASTIENWMREFRRFCPSLVVKMYQGSQAEREILRYELDLESLDEKYHVLLTTYNMATGGAEDRGFLKQLKPRSIILDEGHMIKNCTSARYKYLMKIKAPFRLLLTGTPLQNNLQELVSLLTFIMPQMFVEYEEEIRSIFKIRANRGGAEQGKKRGSLEIESSVQVLSQKRIARAKQMMTPFVLRRKKADVLKDLPLKFQEIRQCKMADTQLTIYNNIISQTRKTYGESGSDMEAQFDNMSNIVIHLRKAADHPLLFRHLYTDDLLKKMTKDIMRDVKYWDSNEDYVYEDMTIMSDFELNRLCKNNKTIKKYELKNKEWMDSGKIKVLEEVLPERIAKGEKVLIFSQFTSMLDILEMVMGTLNIEFLRLDGETKVMERQAMIDKFNQEESIPVFLLSTKAGGFGINLTSANVVVLYDLDFNPQNDKQAEDRAHRVGQTKDVTVIKLICTDSIEEHILRKAEVKLKLDKSISSEEYVEINNDEENQSLRSILKESILQSERKLSNKI
ncbi:SNF2 family N-terminal domain-containing protein [Sporodiniella umbellata]|nr:SNF2 family N-terminal domain-containing protein [Sporodiniella umbellata]